MHGGVARPVSAGFLGFAAMLPAARGLGVGRALGETVIAWSRDAGFRWVVTDWRSTNLEASRAWPALGFRPLFRRLHRSVM
jgi:GNAT superfamily N-acetyltransferase